MLLLIFLLVLSLSYGNLNFIAGGSDGTNSGNTMAYSQDGISWVPLISPFLSQCSGIAYSEIQNKWMALGIGATTMAYSLDGLTWIGLGNSVFATQGNRIAYSSSQNLWMATGLGTNNLAYSRDGIKWTYSNTPFNAQANDVVFSNNFQRWVAVGALNTNNAIAYSFDGINWTGLGVSIFGPVSQGYSVSFNPNVNQFIVGGQGIAGDYAYSLDGINWVDHANSFSTEIQGAAYGQGKWIITGNPTFSNIPFASCTNVVSGVWTDSPSQTVISGGEYIVYHSRLDLWVAVGEGANSIVYSNDSITWNGAGSLFNSDGFIVAMSNTLFVPPSNSISGSLSGNIFYNVSTIINSNSSVTLDGSLTIQGDLYIFGTLTLSNISSLNVTGLLSISGSIIYPFNSLPIQAQTIYAKGTLNFVLNQPLTTSLIIVVAQYQSINGNFNNLFLTFSNTDDETVCITPNYGESTLSVLIYMGECESVGDFPVDSTHQNNGNENHGLAIWAIILIACLVGIVGIAGAIIITLLMRRALLLRTKRQTAVLRKRETENLQAAVRTLKDVPTL